jgi:hypothetical protein
MSDKRQIETIEIIKDERIDAPIDIVFESILEEMNGGIPGVDGKSMHMRIEPWPGGRWFRDLGNNTGHLWGHVQVIKPPKLLEVTGPMFMSYAATNFIQYKLTEEDGATRMKFLHQGMGFIPAEHLKGVNEGWGEILAGIRKTAIRIAGEKRKGAK